MKIVVIKRMEEESGIKTGLLRYSDLVLNCLKYDKKQPTVLEIELSKKNGILKMFFGGIVRPLIFLINNKGDDVVWHATDEMGGWFFPLLKGKKITTVHHVIAKEERGPIYYILWKVLSKLALRNSDAVIAISEETKTEAVNLFGIPEEKVKVISSKPGRQFSPSDSERKKIICCVGELTARKNIRQTLEVFKEFLKKPRFEDYVLIICGKGEEKKSLLEYVSLNNLEKNVSFIERMDDDDLVDLYCSSMAVINTSLHEGLGMVTLEAQACGTPTLYMRGTKNPEAVVKESIPCDSVEDMAEKLQTLLTDNELFATVSEKSRKFAQDFGNEFDKSLLSVYGSCMNTKN